MANPGMRHAKKSTIPDPVNTDLVGATNWNDRHYFLEDDGTTAAGATGDLPYRGTAGLVTLLTGAQGVLTSAGSGNVPAWSMNPSITTIVIGGVTINATEAGFIDGVTAGTVTASKALVVDANKDLASLRNLTLDSAGVLAWSTDVNVIRTAADAIALRRSTNTQVLEVGPSATGLLLAGSSGSASVRSGGAIPLNFGVNTGVNWQINTSGHFLAQGAFNIGDGAGASPVFIYAEQKVSLGALAFASLPAAVAGDMAYVTDSNTAVWGATIAGSGANKVLAFYNGTNWTVAGK